MSAMFAVVASAIYDQGTVAVFSTRLLAEAFTETHRFDKDSHHCWKIVVVPVDPDRLSTEEVCPSVSEPLGSSYRMYAHDFGDGAMCIACGWKR